MYPTSPLTSAAFRACLWHSVPSALPHEVLSLICEHKTKWMWTNKAKLGNHRVHAVLLCDQKCVPFLNMPGVGDSKRKQETSLVLPPAPKQRKSCLSLFIQLVSPRCLLHQGSIKQSQSAGGFRWPWEESVTLWTQRIAPLVWLPLSLYKSVTIQKSTPFDLIKIMLQTLLLIPKIEVATVC